MKAIIIILLLAIIVACGWSGYKKGLIMGIGGVLAILVSLYGAKLLASTFSYDVIPALRPFASGVLEGQMNDRNGVLSELGWDSSDYSVEDLLGMYPERRGEFASACYQALGLDEGTATRLSAKAEAYADENGVDMKQSVIQIACESFCFAGCFILAFLLILILLTVIGNLPNLSYKLPNLDTVNDIGGTVLGVVTGILFCCILVWVLKFTGKLIGSDTLSSSWLTRIFLEHNLVSNYLGI